MQALPHGILLNDYINMCMFKIKIMCFHFFMLYKWTGHCLSKSSLQLMIVSVFTLLNLENERAYSAQVRFHCVLLKKVIYI